MDSRYLGKLVEEELGDRTRMWKRKDLIGLGDLSKDEIMLVMEIAGIARREPPPFVDLSGKKVVTLFYEPSTRTRTSFEVAAKALGAEVINIAVETSSVQKGESLGDTAKTLRAIGASCIVIRHRVSGVPHMLSKMLDIPVINGGDGMHEHPTQGLLDLFTIIQHKGKVEGLKVLIVGDIAHSRVARSNIWALSKLGANVFVFGPPTLVPKWVERMGAKICRSPEEAFRDADVVNVLRMQFERQRGGLIPSVKEFSRLFMVDEEKLSMAKEDVCLMHPGPMNRGVEIDPAVADGRRSCILEQVENGVAVRMAVLYLLLGEGGARG
jgi:aspartate carbamoyltransferase catalytic subunit